MLNWKKLPNKMSTAKITALLSLLMLCMVACRDPKFEKTGDGLQYRFIEQKNGRKPLVGDMMRMHLKYRDTKGKVLYDSHEQTRDFILQLTLPTFIGGIEEGFALMGEGDSAVFSVSADSVFDKTFRQVLPPSVNKGDFLQFEVRMIKVMTGEEYRKQRMAERKDVNELEKYSIDVYLAENDIKAEPIKPGVYFIVLKEGEGAAPVVGDSVEIRYTGSFLSGEVFDGSEKAGGNLQYVLGDGLRLPAWEEAVAGLKQGGIIRLILSSENAYGAEGFGPVPPNTTVVYDIELIGVKKSPKGIL
jgi:FKBP-type peptidyl-prolyl cis-trans isomerase